jgi:hypothetical protein
VSRDAKVRNRQLRKEFGNEKYLGVARCQGLPEPSRGFPRSWGQPVLAIPVAALADLGALAVMNQAQE